MPDIDLAQLAAHLDGIDVASRAAVLCAREDLAGASLPDLDLVGASLVGARFDGVVFRGVRLAGACLDGASLRGADLSGADLTDARASELDARDALLEDAVLDRATLRFADLRGALLDGARLGRADLWGAKLGGTEAPNVDLRAAVLVEADLTGADLPNADLRGAVLQKADLTGANLARADLTGCDLGGAILAGSNLAGARLRELDLGTCDLRHARLADAWFDRTRLRLDQLGGAVGEDVAREWEGARRAYGGLERNFGSLGDTDAAAWCYKRGRRMAKREAYRLARDAARGWRVRDVVVSGATGFADSFAEWLCDYGESLLRVVRAYMVVLLLFAVYYREAGSLLHVATGGARAVADRSWPDVIGFSFLTMCTSSTPDVGLRLSSRFDAYVGSFQYVAGVLLIGLFGFVLGNRIRR